MQRSHRQDACLPAVCHWLGTELLDTFLGYFAYCAFGHALASLGTPPRPPLHAGAPPRRTLDVACVHTHACTVRGPRCTRRLAQVAPWSKDPRNSLSSCTVQGAALHVALCAGCFGRA